MIYALLFVTILANAGETISYKNTKVEDSGDVLFGVTFWSFIFSIPLLAIHCANSDVPFYNMAWQEFLSVISIAFLSMLSIVCWSRVSKNMPMTIAEGVSEIYIAFLTLFSWLIFGKPISLLQVLIMILIVLLCFILALLHSKNINCIGQLKSSDIFRLCQPYPKTLGLRSCKIRAKNKLKFGFIFLALWVVIYIVRGLIPGFLASAGMNGIVYNFLLNTFMLLMVLAFAMFKKRKMALAIKDRWIMCIALSRVGGQSALLYLAKTMNLGIIDGVGVFGIVIVILYEKIVLKEKVGWRCYLVSLLIAASTIILGLI